MTIYYRITNTDDSLLSKINVGLQQPGTVALPALKITNVGTEAAAGMKLMATLANGASTGSVADGSQIVGDGWLEARVSGDVTWTTISGGIKGAGLAITPPAVEASVTIELRLVVPNDATFGPATFQPRLTYRRS